MADTTTLQAIYDGLAQLCIEVGLRESVQILTPKDTPSTAMERSFSVMFPRTREREADNRGNPTNAIYMKGRVEIVLAHMANPKDQKITQRKAFEDEQNVLLKLMAAHGEPLCSVDIYDIQEIVRVMDPKHEWFFTTLKVNIAWWFDLSQEPVVENAR